MRLVVVFVWVFFPLLELRDQSLDTNRDIEGDDHKIEPTLDGACLEDKNEDDKMMKEFGYQLSRAVCSRRQEEMLMGWGAGENLSEGKNCDCFKIYKGIDKDNVAREEVVEGEGKKEEEGKKKADIEPYFDEDGRDEEDSQGYSKSPTSPVVYQDEVFSWPSPSIDEDDVIETSNSTDQIEYGLSAANLVVTLVEVCCLLWNMLRRMRHAV